MRSRSAAFPEGKQETRHKVAATRAGGDSEQDDARDRRAGCKLACRCSRNGGKIEFFITESFSRVKNPPLRTLKSGVGTDGWLRV